MKINVRVKAKKSFFLISPSSYPFISFRSLRTLSPFLAPTSHPTLHLHVHLSPSQSKWCPTYVTDHASHYQTKTLTVWQAQVPHLALLLRTARTSHPNSHPAMLLGATQAGPMARYVADLVLKADVLNLCYHGN